MINDKKGGGNGGEDELSVSQDDDGFGNQRHFKGRNVVIFFFSDDGSIQVQDFLSSKFVTPQQYKSYQHILGYFDSKKGVPPFHPHKVKKLEEIEGLKVWEFKSGQLRVAWVWSPVANRRFEVYVIHACNKKSDDWQKGELETLKNRIKRFKAKAEKWKILEASNGKKAEIRH